MAKESTPLRDGHPDDSGMGEQSERFDEFTGGYTEAEHNRAMDRLAADIRSNVARIHKNIGTPPARTHAGATDGHVPLGNVRPVAGSVEMVAAHARLGRAMVTGSREQIDAAVQDVVDAAKGGGR